MKQVPKIDFNDPSQRFQLLSLARLNSKAHAGLIDLKTQEQIKVSEGDLLVDSGYKVARIDMTKSTIYLRGPKLDSIALRLVKRTSN